MSNIIALGMGNNVDYEIEWNSKIIEDFILEYGIEDAELIAKSQISNMRNLIISILVFLRKGKGGEIYVDNAAIIEEFSEHFKKNVTLGGTPVRAAIAMAKLNYKSTLHLVTMNDHVRRLLPPSSNYVCSSEMENLFPHLIVQYNKGIVIKANGISIETERANRLIYVNDPENEKMKISDQFLNNIKNAEVLLVSGFNAMQDKSLFTKRVLKLAKMIDSMPESGKVFYEDACYHNSDFIKILHEILMDKIDIYSLNEDEMENYLGREIDLLDPEAVASALVDISSFLTSKVIIVHTRYWALAYGNNAQLYRGALEGGVCMSNTRFRSGDEYTEADYIQTADYPDEKEGSEFAQAIHTKMKSKVCCIPSFDIRTKRATTIGLGDSFVGGFIPHLLGLRL